MSEYFDTRLTANHFRLLPISHAGLLHLAPTSEHEQLQVVGIRQPSFFQTAEPIIVGGRRLELFSRDDPSLPHVHLFEYAEISFVRT